MVLYPSHQVTRLHAKPLDAIRASASARRRLGRLAGFAIAALIGIGGAAAAQGGDEAQVLAVAQRLFDGMRTRDTSLLHSVFDSSARLISVRQGVVRATPVDGFIRAVVSAKEGAVWNERIWDPEVRIDGEIAHLWARYDFHLNDKLSHCGVDAFQLAKTASGWKIVEIADTRRTEGCTAPTTK